MFSLYVLTAGLRSPLEIDLAQTSLELSDESLLVHPRRPGEGWAVRRSMTNHRVPCLSVEQRATTKTKNWLVDSESKHRVLITSGFGLSDERCHWRRRPC